MQIDAELGNKFWDLLLIKHTVMSACTWEYSFTSADYQFMARDISRGEAYRKVINNIVKDKTVVEIG